MTSEEL